MALALNTFTLWACEIGVATWHVLDGPDANGTMTSKCGRKFDVSRIGRHEWVYHPAKPDAPAILCVDCLREIS